MLRGFRPRKKQSPSIQDATARIAEAERARIQRDVAELLPPEERPAGEASQTGKVVRWLLPGGAVLAKALAVLGKVGLKGQAFTAEHGLGAMGVGIAVASSAFASYMIIQNQYGEQQAANPMNRRPLNWTLISHFAKADIDPITTGSITPSIGKPSEGLSGAGGGAVAVDPSEKKLPGYVLRDVFEGVALVQGSDGVQAVRLGFTLPGGNKVTAIERHADQWVVVTTGGIIAQTP